MPIKNGGCIAAPAVPISSTEPLLAAVALVAATTAAIQVDVAGAGGSTHHATGNGAGRSAHARITGHRADNRTAGSTNCRTGKAAFTGS